MGGLRRTGRRITKKRRSINTIATAENDYEEEIMRHYLGKVKPIGLGYDVFADIPSSRTVGGVTNLRNAPLTRMPVVPIVSGEIVENAFDYNLSLKTSSRLDRDFTHNGRRFIFLGSPFTLTPQLGLAAYELIYKKAAEYQKNGHYLTSLINLYHGITAFYLGLVNRSFDCLDMLREITRHIRNGGDSVGASVCIKTLDEVSKGWDGNPNPKELELQTKFINVADVQLANLNWGDNKSPLHLLDQKMLWESISGRLQHQYQQKMAENYGLGQAQGAFPQLANPLRQGGFYEVMRAHGGLNRPGGAPAPGNREQGVEADNIGGGGGG